MTARDVRRSRPTRYFLSQMGLFFFKEYLKYPVLSCLFIYFLLIDLAVLATFLLTWDIRKCLSYFIRRTLWVGNNFFVTLDDNNLSTSVVKAEISPVFFFPPETRVCLKLRWNLKSELLLTLLWQPPGNPSFSHQGTFLATSQMYSREISSYLALWRVYQTDKINTKIFFNYFFSVFHFLKKQKRHGPTLYICICKCIIYAFFYWGAAPNFSFKVA